MIKQKFFRIKLLVLILCSAVLISGCGSVFKVDNSSNTSSPTTTTTPSPTQSPSPFPSPSPSPAPSPGSGPGQTPTPTPAPTPTPVITNIFTAELSAHDSTLFLKSDGYTNGGCFNNGWKADHVSFSNGNMILTLDNMSSSGKPYSSGEYKTKSLYGYGTLEARIKTASCEGIVAGSLFIYTGPTDGNQWDEIDIEFLGKDSTKMQTNYFTNGIGSHEATISLGFDASAAFHIYKIEWQSNSIRWFVDGVLVHTENGSKGALPTTPGRIMANLWPGTGLDYWLGSFAYHGPVCVYYDYIKYTPF